MINQTRNFGIAFVGCGYAANFYQQTLVNHPRLKLIGVHDRNLERLRAYCECYNTHAYTELEHLITDNRVEIVVNLTEPRSHFEVTKAALERNKHVYSEKPLAWTFEESLRLQQIAKANNSKLAVAPCSILGEAAQTALQIVRSGKLGNIRLAYADLDDGPITMMNFETWKSRSGAAWPFKDEFETGCSLEHSAYAISWLVAMFGSVVEVSTYADILVPEKIDKYGLNLSAPDFSVGILKFESGMIARVTNSIIAKKNHSLQLFGDQYSLTVEELWNYDSPIWLHSWCKPSEQVTYANSSTTVYPEVGYRMDFSRGINELANAIEGGRKSLLSCGIALHVEEISHALSIPCTKKIIASRYCQSEIVTPT